MPEIFANLFYKHNLWAVFIKSALIACGIYYMRSDKHSQLVPLCVATLKCVLAQIVIF